MREESPLLTNHIGAQASLRRLHEHAKFSSIHQEEQGACCTWGQDTPRSPVTLLRQMSIDISASLELSSPSLSKRSGLLESIPCGDMKGRPSSIRRSEGEQSRNPLLPILSEKYVPGAGSYFVLLTVSVSAIAPDRPTDRSSPFAVVVWSVEKGGYAQALTYECGSPFGAVSWLRPENWKTKQARRPNFRCSQLAPRSCAERN